jgi:teichuronopeptide biosynthesis TupA-like protein
MTFNEKLYWLMLYYRPPRATTVSDKYAVRSHVTERVGPEILSDLYGVWEHVADIDFETLPDAFVLKVNWADAPSSARSPSVRVQVPAASSHPSTTAAGATRSCCRARSGSEIKAVRAAGPGSA